MSNFKFWDYEKKQVYREPDHRHDRAVRKRRESGRHLSRPGHKPRDLLQLEGKIFGHGRKPAQAAQGTGNGAGPVQEDRGGAGPFDHRAKGCGGKKALGPGAKRELVSYAHKRHGISKRRACGLFDIRESVYYYTPRARDDGRGPGGPGRAGGNQHAMGLLDDAPPPEGTGPGMEP